MIPPPIPNSYWVKESLLLASEYPGHRDPARLSVKLAKFLDAGIRVFIDLTFEAELEPYSVALCDLASRRGVPIEIHRAPIRDAGIPGSTAEMNDILNLIDSRLASDRPVCVHCLGGCGRTGLVIGCYLVRHGATGQEALNFLMERWKTVEKYPRLPASPETAKQRAYILNWMAPR